MPQPVSLAELNGMESNDFVERLAGIFEHSSWVAEAASGFRPFASREALHARMAAIVREADADRQRALLEAHPQLGSKAARERQLTEASNAEQASAGLDRLQAEESARFATSNQRYHEKFGFPFIIAVRGQRDRLAILAALDRRLHNTIEEEIETALTEVGKIAWFRLSDLIAPDHALARIGAHGRLTTHALDTRLGQPARGLKFTLFLISDDSRIALCAGQTNADGRTDAPLLAGEGLLPGSYELVFGAGAYQAQCPGADSGFYDLIPIRFVITDPNAHYHVPLLLSPFGYSTYRGS